MKRLLVIISSICSILLTGMTFAPASQSLSYHQLTPGDSVEQLTQILGQPRYQQNSYNFGKHLTYYIYQHNNKIGIDDTTRQIVDIQIVDDYYATPPDFKIGDTGYKIQRLLGPNHRQMHDGKLYYLYREGNTRLILQLAPTSHAVSSIRLTSLPIEIQDNPEYLPDDATSEALNPLIADKTIDTSSLPASAKPTLATYRYHP